MNFSGVIGSPKKMNTFSKKLSMMLIHLLCQSKKSGRNKEKDLMQEIFYVYVATTSETHGKKQSGFSSYGK